LTEYDFRGIFLAEERRMLGMAHSTDPGYAYLSGQEFERSFFGCTSADFPASDYLQFSKAYARVREQQLGRYGWDVLRPKTSNSMLLYETVQHAVAQAGLTAQVKMLCCVGSEIDHYHRADGAFELDPDRYVLFDLTANSRPEIINEKRMREEEFYPTIVIEAMRLARPGGYEHYGRRIAEKFKYMTTKGFELVLALRRQEELERRIKARQRELANAEKEAA
jgi:hypothetical protein